MNNDTTIQWLKEIRGHFEKSEIFFDVERCNAIDNAIHMLERRVDPGEDKYVDGYIKGVEVAAEEYKAEIKKLIDEKDRLKGRLNLIYGTAGFKAAQVYDGRLERLEESVNDLRSKVNTMSWDRHIYMHREEAKQLFKDLINEYYGIKPLDIHCDFLTKCLNKPVITDCFKTAEEYREDFLNLKSIMDCRYVGHMDVHHDLNDEIDELKWRVKKLEEKVNAT